MTTEWKLASSCDFVFLSKTIFLVTIMSPSECGLSELSNAQPTEVCGQTCIATFDVSVLGFGSVLESCGGW